MHKHLFVVLMALAIVGCQNKVGEKVSFIDADTQAFSEKVLRNQMDSVDASAGALAIMEVSTGKIIAWVELNKGKETLPNDSIKKHDSKSNGDSETADNRHLLLEMIESGSLFFPISMMIALDDNKVQLSDTINTGDGSWHFMGRVIKDHNYNMGGYGLINAEQVVSLSSGVGMSKLIYNGYENNLSVFKKELKKINWDNSAESVGENVMMHDLKLLMNSKLIVWQALGYGIYMKPISLLGFYNAIANDGCMVQSRIAGELDSTVIINEKICSEATLKALQRCLTETVANGTGKYVKSDLVRIAGKTGNVQEFDKVKNKMINTVSFCGYFPVEKPKYTCIVLLNDPQNGILSGGKMAGVVVKEVAEWLTEKDLNKNQLNDLVLTNL